jgi:hypothetical protein
MESWLRGPLAPVLDGLLAESRLRAGGVFDPIAVHRLVGEGPLLQAPSRAIRPATGRC